MPRTIVPEEQQRASDLSDLAGNFRPTPNRVVYVDSDADGAGNFFQWDLGANAANADGTTKIASNIPEYASGGANEGLWRRMQLPFAGADTNDLTETNSPSLDGTDNAYFTNSRAIDAIEGMSDTLQINNGVSLNSTNLTDLPTPTSGTDAVNKEYVDGVAQGLEVKDSVDATNTTGIDLTSTANPNPIDTDANGNNGYTLSDGDRILLQGQSDATENGIYDAVTATDPSTWTLANDFNSDDDVVSGSFVFVENGYNEGGNSYIVTTDDPIDQGVDAINWQQFSSAGKLIGGNGLNKNGNTFNVDVSESSNGIAGKFLGADGSNSLKVQTSSRLVSDTGSGDFLDIDIGISDNGSDVGTTKNVTGIDFGSNLDVSDNTGSGNQRVKVDVDASGSTSITIDEDGSQQNGNANHLNFTNNVQVTSGSGSADVDISIPDEEIQDAVYNNVLSGNQSLITVTYDDSNNEVDYQVQSNLSNYTNDLNWIDGVDIQDGSGTTVRNPVEAIELGSNINVASDSSGASGVNGKVTLETDDTLVQVQEGGTTQESVTTNINFATGIGVNPDGSGSVTVTNDVRFGTATFSGDGVKTSFDISHGLSSAPSSWTIEATTDEGSGHSHSTADSNNITVVYDTPPPSGTNNIQLNYLLNI